MQDFIFVFATKASQSLIQRFTVTADVITFYSRGREQENFGANAISYFIKPCAPCDGKDYKVVQQTALEHQLAPLHKSIAEQKSSHVHLQQCQLVTPQDFNCFMDQLAQFQSDPAARQQLYQTPAYLQTKGWIELAKSFKNAKPDPEAMKNPFKAAMVGSIALASIFMSEYSLEIDTTSDYFPVEDIHAAKAAYAEYYQQHKTQLEARYLQLQKDMTWSDEFSEIGHTVLSSILQSGSYAALQSTLKETLKAHGVTEERAQWAVHAVMLSVMAYANTTWYPFVFAASTIAVLKTLNELNVVKCPDPLIRLSSNLAGTLSSIWQNLPNNAFGYLNLSLSFLTALPTAAVSTKVSSYLTQSFWRYCYNKSASNDAIAVANQGVEAVMKPHQH